VKHESTRRDDERVSTEGAEWVVKKDRGLTAEEQDAFFQWLARDPRHGEWFARHQWHWESSRLLAEWRPEHSDMPNPDLLAYRGWTRKRLFFGGAVLALAASIVVAFIVGTGSLQSDGQGEQVVRNGLLAADSYRYCLLEDGSALDLKEGTSIEIVYTSSKRLIRLLDGELFCSVAKDPERPFVVDIDGTEVSALGTAFNVRLAGDSLEVLVTEGTVLCELKEVGGVASEAVELLPRPFRQRVEPGQMSRISLAKLGLSPPVLEKVEDAQIATKLDWRHELLDFDSTPLAKAVAQFNRRNRIQILIADSELESLPITASVRSSNVEGFVKLLELAAGVRSDRSDRDKIILTSVVRFGEGSSR